MMFPDTSKALLEPNGLLAAGGDLEPHTLLLAYRRGIFPWFDAEQPILWWTPNPRAVLFPASFHRSRSLRRTMARSNWSVSCDRDFAAVVDACAAPRAGQRGTWITAEMRAAYLRLHAAGYAHSLEIHSADELLGGLYGIRLGRVFFGESMFSAADNASKMALAALVWLASDGALVLIDCQMETQHLASLGAETLPRQEFENILADAINDTDVAWPVPRGDQSPLDKQLGRVLPAHVRDLL